MIKIEKITGGKIYPTQTNLLIDNVEELDTRLKIVEKNGGGTGGGGSGEAETTGKDIYREEGVEVVTNKVYKNKTVYRKSYYNKKYNEEIVLDDVNKENLFNLFVNLKYGESAEKYYYEIPTNIAMMFRVEAQVYFSNGKIIPKFPSPEEISGSSDSKVQLLYTAHIEYIKDSDSEVTDFTGKDIYSEEGLEVVTNKVYKNKTVYRKCFYDKKNIFEITDNDIKLKNIFRFQNKLSVALTETNDLQIATGSAIIISTGEYKYQMLQMQINKNEDKLFIYPIVIKSHEDEEMKEIYYEYSSFVEYIKDSDSEVTDFTGLDVYGENEVETKTNKLLLGKEVYRVCLYDMQSSFDVNNLKIKRATIHSINQIAKIGPDKENIFIVGGNILSLGENGAMLYGAYIGESGVREYLSVLCSVGTAEGTFGEADVFIEYTKEKANTEAETKKDEYGEQGVEILTNKTWKGKPVYRVSHYGISHASITMKYSNVLNIIKKGTVRSNERNAVFAGFNEYIIMIDTYSAIIYMSVGRDGTGENAKEVLVFDTSHNFGEDFSVIFDLHIEYIKDEE